VLTHYSMTWAGKQGFQSAPVFQSFKVDGMKAPMGNVHAERGLAYYEVVLSGHMIPQFSPWVRRRAARAGPAMRGADDVVQSAFQGMQYLTGQRDTP
jgi:carboxypeptidase D